MKRYEYKLYDRAGTFKTVLTPLVTNQIRFSSQINGGQGEMTIDLNINFDYTGVIRTDIIKVWCFSDTFPEWTLIYSWFVSQIERRYEKSKSLVSLKVLGIASLLSKMTVNASYASDPSAIISSILSTYNTIRTGIDITAGTLETAWFTHTTTFSWTTCIDAIRQVVDATIKWFYIGPDVILNFISSVSTVRMAIDSEISSIKVEENLEKIVNSVDIEYTTGIVTRTNPTSITAYDTMGKKVARKEITTLLSAQAYGDAYVAEFWDPKPGITINVNDSYPAWIESLKPWMFINILNSITPYNNLQIQKIEYTSFNVQIELSSYNSFSQESLW
jgi:hypothetical protein